MAATLEQVTQALLDAQQAMSAMRQQVEAELRCLRDEAEDILRRAQLASASRTTPTDFSFLEGKVPLPNRKGKVGKKGKGFDKNDVEAMRVHMWTKCDQCGMHGHN